MYKREIELKQNTPLIHFKYKDEEASIRPTELKPKLDKFLREEVFKREFHKYKKHLVGYRENKSQEQYDGKEAFNYKVWVEAKGKNHCVNKAPMYFGRDGKPVIHTYIVVIFMTLDKTLLDAIEANSCGFFNQYNFGARTSKGYGSFSVEHSQNTNLQKEYNVQDNFQYITEYKGKGINDWYSMMEQVKKLYDDIRKKYMESYCENKKYSYDRREIASKLFGTENKYKQNGILVTDLLGLASSETWNIKTKDGILKQHIEKKIQRFPSPIFIKPILKDDNSGYDIYIKIHDIDISMLNQTFKITRKRTKDNSEQVKKKPLYFKTPPSFSVDNIIQYGLKDTQKDGLWTKLKKIESR